jgi:ABC-type Fe3+ transport system permease subunit
MWVDRGPAGEARVSLFPLALLALDPFVWTCVWNSLIFAVFITLSSLVVGVGLGWVLVRRRFWGRPFLRGAVAGLLAVPPVFLALGLLGLSEPPNPGSWSSAVSWANVQELSLESWRGLPLWALWFWTTLPSTVALVALTSASAFEQLEPEWTEAARLAGASPLRAWWSLTWPLVRPAAARAAALVFPLALVEPGSPLVLNLRRTIAFQVVQTAAGRDPFPRIAVWATLAGLIGLAGAILICWWGRGSAGGLPLPLTSRRNRPPPPRTSSLPALACTLALACWASLGWLPTLGLLRVTSSGGWAGLGFLVDPAQLLRRLVQPPVPELAINSLVLGLEAAAVVTLLAALVQRDRRSRSVPVAPARLPWPTLALSPVVQGVGILSVPWLLERAARGLGDSPGWERTTGHLAHLAAALSPHRNPWSLLVGSVVLVVGVPLVNGWHESTWFERTGERSQFEAAQLAGASKSRAWIVATQWQWGRWFGRFILVWCVAATNLAPALFLTPWADGRTITPGVLALADAPDGARPQAAALALCAIAINLISVIAGRATATPPHACAPARL